MSAVIIVVIETRLAIGFAARSAVTLIFAKRIAAIIAAKAFITIELQIVAIYSGGLLGRADKIAMCAVNPKRPPCLSIV